MRKTSHITNFVKDHVKTQLAKVECEYIALPNGDTALNIKMGGRVEGVTLPKDGTTLTHFQLSQDAVDNLLGF